MRHAAAVPDSKLGEMLLRNPLVPITADVARRADGVIGVAYDPRLECDVVHVVQPHDYLEGAVVVAELVAESVPATLGHFEVIRMSAGDGGCATIVGANTVLTRLVPTAGATVHEKLVLECTRLVSGADGIAEVSVRLGEFGIEIDVQLGRESAFGPHIAVATHGAHCRQLFVGIEDAWLDDGIAVLKRHRAVRGRRQVLAVRTVGVPAVEA